ncbi:RNA polymerase sigma-70 factor (ECF subfamily) [Chitinophaga niastensis]|uniref:RNA polymerase sigma-70 factor (ECF subfamily) n=1 Tax=Chitinophaga niastensis TaxID=536980 RepID=A0A2P8HGP5_CHINA|nr:sigma-70 family RNA polymerase sigma factor [Chitinophaga niastensis]PSL45392.1 RNA polymerase sigma-70 factor (ECF subfamily) [Chitinophaga niastensis]
MHMSSDSNTTGTLPGANTINPHQWVEMYADYLYTYALTRLNDEEQARDLVQETFLAALERIDKFEGKSSERTWLTAILKHKIIDIYRKKSSGFAKRTDIADAEQEQADFFDHDNGHWNAPYRPHLFGMEEKDPMANKEFISILQRCMQKLPSLWLAVFTMKHMEDESTDIICSELKVTPSNFWVIIHRAKINLRACLQKNWF